MADEVVLFDDALRERVEREFEEEATPEFINLLALGKAAYEHGYHGFISLEKVLDWVAGMYASGVEQRQARSGEGDGDTMILTNSSDVMNTASYLSMRGMTEGYLSD